jgi:hypothetical protein
MILPRLAAIALSRGWVAAVWVRSFSVKTIMDARLPSRSSMPSWPVPGIAAIRGDARRPADILDHSEVRAQIDLSRPVAVLMGSVLHYFTGEDGPAGVIARFMEAAAPGSYLALSHGTNDMLPEESAQVSEFYRGIAMPLILRSRHEVNALFAGLELVEPGVVFTTEWRPPHKVDDPGRAGIYAGVARKPGVG